MSPFQGPVGNVTDKRSVGGIEGRLVRRFHDRAVELVQAIPASRILDVGCGEGQMIHHIVSANPALSAVAIDDDDPVLRKHWERFANPRLAFQVADVYDLPFDDNSFRIVTAFSVLQHLDDPHSALREIRRVCNGWLIASVPWEPWWRLGNVLRGRYVWQLGNTPGHVNNWTRRGFRNLVEQHGRPEYLRIVPLWTLSRVRICNTVP